MSPSQDYLNTFLSAKSAKRVLTRRRSEESRTVESVSNDASEDTAHGSKSAKDGKSGKGDKSDKSSKGEFVGSVRSIDAAAMRACAYIEARSEPATTRTVQQARKSSGGPAARAVPRGVSAGATVVVLPRASPLPDPSSLDAASRAASTTAPSISPSFLLFSSPPDIFQSIAAPSLPR